MTPILVLPPLGGPGLLQDFLTALEPAARGRVVELPVELGQAPSTETIARRVLGDWPTQLPRPVAVFGISLGSMVAQWIAARAPERVSHLVLASTTARPLDHPSGALRAAGLARCLLAPRDEAHACLVDGVLSESSTAPRRSADASAPRRRDLLWWAAAAAAHDARAQLESIGAPTTVLSGADDRLIPPSAQADVAAAIAGAEHHVLEGCGHDLTLEAPSRAAAAVRRAVGLG